MTYATHVEFELERAIRLVCKDHRQRWVTMDGKIHETAVPFQDAISVFWMGIPRCVAYNWRPAALAHPAIGAL